MSDSSKNWRQEEIIIFIRANNEFRLIPKDQIEGWEPTDKLEVPRWHNTQDIVVDERNDGPKRYLVTVKLNRLPSRQRYKRLLGSIRQLWVFDAAIPVDG